MATDRINPAPFDDVVAIGTSERRIVDTIRRNWWFAAIVVLVALVATFVLTEQQAPRYAASTTVVLRTNETESLFPLRSSTPLELTRSAAVEQLYAETPEFIEVARAAVPEDIRISSRIESSELIFTARGGDPEAVAAAADAWADTYLAERRLNEIMVLQEDAAFVAGEVADLMAQRDLVRSELDRVEELISEAANAEQLSRLLVRKVSLEGSLADELAPIEEQLDDFRERQARFAELMRFLAIDDISALVVAGAEVPTEPISPNLSRNLLVGGLLGLGLGVLLPYVRESFSDAVDEKDDVSRSADLPILGAIPIFERPVGSGVEVLDRPDSPASEQYRALLTAIDFASVAQPIRSLLVTSAVPSEGKTTTALNLAALAAQFQKVLLIDADMRRPTVHDVVGVPNGLGLADVLAGGARFEDVRASVRHGETTFDVLPSGPPIRDSSVLLRGSEWQKLLNELVLYDLVVIDAPPLLAITDPLLIGRAVDAQLLTVRWGTTERRTLTAARNLLVTNQTRTIGVVLNATPKRTGYDGHYAAYASDRAEVAKRNSGRGDPSRSSTSVGRGRADEERQASR